LDLRSIKASTASETGDLGIAIDLSDRFLELSSALIAGYRELLSVKDGHG
jgi:hypothetical protein